MDDSADLEEAAEKIRVSKTLDLAASCSSDNSLIVFESIYDELVDKLKKEGGYVVDAEEKDRLQNTLWEDGSPADAHHSEVAEHGGADAQHASPDGHGRMRRSGLCRCSDILESSGTARRCHEKDNIEARESGSPGAPVSRQLGHDTGFQCNRSLRRGTNTDA